MNKHFRQYLTESGYILSEAGGQSKGTMEMAKIRLNEARAYAILTLEKSGMKLDEEIPDFNKNFMIAQKGALSGDTVRKDMPVIDAKDVRAFQNRLKKGHIDVTKPFAKETNPSNPFPNGLSGEDAKIWLRDGMKYYDGDAKDDRIKVRSASIPVGKLLPIQKQIYFDKAIGFLTYQKSGAAGVKKFITGTSNAFIVSSDNRIIDGHHRYLAGVLVDPTTKVNCVVIDLPIKKLLPLTLSYSDAIGNKRNA